LREAEERAYRVFESFEGEEENDTEWRISLPIIAEKQHRYPEQRCPCR